MRKPWRFLALLFAVGLSALIIVFRHNIANLGGLGYLSAFLISAIACATIVFPVPHWAMIIALGAALNPYWIGIVSGLGGTLGEMNGYILGYGGRIAVERTRSYQRVEGLMKRWGGPIIFVLALVPNPLFDLAGIAAGTARFPLWKFILYGAMGRIIKHIGYALAGSWGLRLLPDWLA